MEQVWATSAEDKLFEDIELMTEEQYDEFLDSLNEEELDEIIGRFGRGIKNFQPQWQPLQQKARRPSGCKSSSETN